MGIENLLAEAGRELRANAIGLVSHAAARMGDGRTSAEALRSAAGRRLRALFGPEHGFAIRGAAGEVIAHIRHPQWDIPIWSLYGDHRKPTSEMVRDLDLLIVDFQTLPFRPYTYLATLRHVMEAAGEAGLPVWVADRPVPLPTTIDGAMPDAEQQGFVCPAPLPMAYGMTAGETARWLMPLLPHPPALRILTMTGYNRDSRSQPDWPPWSPPSPAIRSWDSALCYLITLFCEALPLLTNDRHGPDAFQVLYGPPEWEACRHDLADAFGPDDGLRITPCPPEPRTHRPGVRLTVTDPQRLRPVGAAVRVLERAQHVLGADRLWNHAGARPEWFDRLFGTRAIREQLQRGITSTAIADGWIPATAAFRAARQAVLQYAGCTATVTVGRRYRGRATPSSVQVHGPTPTRAIVLAAGLGQRMAPLSLDLPKPAMPLHNQPLLWYTLRRLERWGVREVLVNLHHRANAVMRAARAVCPAAMRLTFSFEPERMETGGALARASWFFGADPLWIVNGDIFFDLDAAPLVAAMRSPPPLAALWMTPDSGPRTVALHPDGRIRDFDISRPGSADSVTFCGIHLVSPRILDFIPAGKPSSIIDAYNRAMAAGHSVRGVIVPGTFWSDLGTPASYLDTHRTAPIERSRPTGDPSDRADVVVGQRVVIGPNCRLRRCVLWDDVRLLAGTTVCDTVIGRGVTLGGLIDQPTIALTRMLQPAFNAVVDRLGWPVAQTAVTPLPPRGSARTFYRIRWKRRTAMLVHEDGSRRENRYYAVQSRFLADLGLPVPAVLTHDPAAGITVLADGGDRSLMDAVSAGGSRRRAWMAHYRRVLDAMAHWHREGARRARPQRLPLMPRFTPGLFAWELNYFADHCLRRHFNMTAPAIRTLLRDLRSATRPLRDQPQVLIHRDLQSSNILLQRGGILIIDYQGMRFGPAAYDLASLLYDPYVRLAPDDRLELLAWYRQRADAGNPATTTAPNGDAPLSETILHRAALQRLAQALGAYGRLGAHAATRRFRQHIPAALDHMRQAADALGGLTALRAWLECPRKI